MKLVEAEVSGYKRLAASSRMELDGDLICIIGPNGAGKSSFLDALVHLTSDKEFAPSEPTRAEDGGTLKPSLRAKFVLDDEDHKALTIVPESHSAKFFEIFKTDGPRVTSHVTPEPQRDFAQRRRVGALLEDLAKSRWLGDVRAAEKELDPEPNPSTAQLVEGAHGTTMLSDQTLDPEKVALLESLRDRLWSIIDSDHLPGLGKPMPAKYEQLADRLDACIEHETAIHPHNRALDVLRERLPRFIKFSDQDRLLRAEYDLNADPDSPIKNLLTLGGTSWDIVSEVVADGDKGRKNVLLEQLNGALKREITHAWGQTPLTVKIDIDAHILTVLMSMQADDYIKIDQHSDGLRQFVALRAFIALQGDMPKPIILVDEAERHLHYDAQADLINVFEEQEEAEAIIYTTHSAGALPRDIGLGLRGIVPIMQETEVGPVMADHSRIINEFWNGDHGFTPMLIAMGASTFAFSAAQKACVTEGFTDALLLPSLIREAVELPRLDYQVVPHLSRARPEDVPNLDLVAARVSYLVDGDNGGKGHRAKLEEGGVLPEQILTLGGVGSDLTLEDLVDPTVLVAIINDELKAQTSSVQLTVSDVPVTRRMQGLKRWCEAQSTDQEVLRLPGKATLATELLRRRKQGLVDPKHRGTLRQLDEQIKDVLATPSASLNADKA